MAQIENQNPGSSEVQSPLLAGITEGLNKLSAIFNLKTGTLNDVKLNPVPIDDSPDNKNRIYEASSGNRLWLSSPAPVIKKNGAEITQSGSNFTIDYVGGSVTFTSEDKPDDDDTITVTATYIIAGSEQIDSIISTLSSVQTQSDKYKGNYDNLGALQLAHNSAKNGDFAIVFSPLAVYAWKNDGWYDTRSIEDLSDYYNKSEVNNLVDQKEPKISQHGSSTSDDDYYLGGRKTWQNISSKVRSVILTGLSTASDAAISASDTVLSAIGKLQAQVSKATQRAYITGTGAPSTSTEGKVGQRYVNTSNGDEYTCQEASSSNYVWRLHTKSVNGKIPDQGGNIKLVPSDIGAVSIDIVFPIGYIFSWAPTSGGPDLSTAEKVKSYMGFGTWKAYGSGKTLVGLDSGTEQFSTPGKTGGEISHTLTERELPSVSPGLKYISGSPVAFDGGSESGYQITFSSGKVTAGNLISPFGGGQSHNNLQPYIVVYYWQRIS